MPVEIEAKMKVPDFAPIRDRLRAVGAAPTGSVMESNTFFDTDDRRLLTKDQGLRLRSTRNPATSAETSTITFKGARQQGPLKSREERELNVENAKDAMALLELLGYFRVLTFQKRRESWTLGDCEVELDELPYLGLFVEIEGPSEKSVMKIREQLQLGTRSIIKESYIALLLTHLQEGGISDRVVMFK
jgi:adenylate cyclase class 2